MARRTRRVSRKGGKKVRRTKRGDRKRTHIKNRRKGMGLKDTGRGGAAPLLRNEVIMNFQTAAGEVLKGKKAADNDLWEEAVKLYEKAILLLDKVNITDKDALVNDYPPAAKMLSNLPNYKVAAEKELEKLAAAAAAAAAAGGNGVRSSKKKRRRVKRSRRVSRKTRRVSRKGGKKVRRSRRTRKGGGFLIKKTRTKSA
jgi:hypothetical protein